jgi:hypothetical protein
MSAVFRLEGRDPIEVSEEWNLEEQIRETSAWLENSANAADVRGSVLDIGFTSRLHPRLAVQGEVIPLSFMRRLVELEIVLWLSIYNRFDGH